MRPGLLQKLYGNWCRFVCRFCGGPACDCPCGLCGSTWTSGWSEWDVCYWNYMGPTEFPAFSCPFHALVFSIGPEYLAHRNPTLHPDGPTWACQLRLLLHLKWSFKGSCFSVLMMSWISFCSSISYLTALQETTRAPGSALRAQCSPSTLQLLQLDFNTEQLWK